MSHDPFEVPLREQVQDLQRRCDALTDQVGDLREQLRQARAAERAACVAYLRRLAETTSTQHHLGAGAQAAATAIRKAADALEEDGGE